MGKIRKTIITCLSVLLAVLCCVSAQNVFGKEKTKRLRVYAADETVAPLYSITVWHNYPASGENFVFTFHSGVDVAIYETFNATELYDAVKGKIRINGKTLEEINAETSGTVTVADIGQTHKLTLNVARSYLKWDGTDTFTMESGIYFPNGAKTDRTTSKIMYEGTIDENAYSQSGCKFKEYVIANGEIAPFRTFVLYHNSFNAGYDTLIAIFNNGNADVPVLVDGMSSSTLMEIVGDKIKINGVKISEITSGLSFLNIGSDAKIAMNVLQSANILKKDGTDVIEIEEGLVLPNGLTIDRGVKQVLYEYVGGEGSNSDSLFCDDIKVNFYGNGADGNMNGISVTYGTTVTLPKNAFGKTSWIFKGWSTEENGEVVYGDEAEIKFVIGEGITEVGELNLYAVWEAITYTVTYKSEDGSRVLGVVNVLSGNGAVYSGEKLVKDGTDEYYYRFEKWVTVAGGDEEADLGSVTEDKVVYAKFIKEQRTVAPLYSITVWHNYPASGENFVFTFHSGVDVAIYETFNATELYDAVKGKIRINGKTLEEINAETSGTVTVADIGQTHKLTLNVARSYLKWDGTDTFTMESGIYFPNGAKTDRTTSKIMYEGTIDENAYSQSGCKFKEYVIANGEIAPFRTFVLYHNSFNAGYDTLIAIFNNGNADVPVLVDGMSSSTLMEIVGDKIKINGVKISEITSGLSFLNIGSDAKIAMNVLQSANILKKDGTDVIEIEEGLVLPNGLTIDRGVKQLLYEYVGGEGSNSDSLFCDYIEKTGETVNVIGCGVFKNANDSGYDAIYFTFDNPVADKYTVMTTPYVMRNILINGRTLEEINEITGNVSIIWNPNEGKHQLLVFNKQNAVTSLNFDDKDRIKIKAGTLMLNGSVTENDYDVIIKKSDSGLIAVNVGALVNNYIVFDCVDKGDAIELSIWFELANPETAGAISTDKLSFKGQSVSAESVQWKVVGDETVLSITFNKTELATGDAIKILSEFRIAGDLQTTEEIELVYSEKYNFWIERQEGEFSGEKISITELNAPKVIADGSLMIELNFNKILTPMRDDSSYVRLQDYNLSISELIGGTKAGLTGYYYDKTIIGNLIFFDIPASTMENVFVNGKSLKEINNDYAVTVGMYEKQIYIVIAPNSENKLYANPDTVITVEIKSGVRSYMGGNTTEDEKFYYDYKNGKWSVTKPAIEEDPAPSGDKDKNNGCLLSIGYNAFGVCFMVVCAVAVIMLKKKRGK